MADSPESEKTDQKPRPASPPPARNLAPPPGPPPCEDCGEKQGGPRGVALGLLLCAVAGALAYMGLDLMTGHALTRRLGGAPEAGEDQ